jgi:predicted nucleotidyltransferase
MRLTEAEQKAIINTAIKTFGKTVSVILFGSKVDDKAKGGDIDLLIIPNTIVDKSEIYNQKIDFITYLKNLIGFRKIDILIKYENDTRDVIKTAIETGIKLC